MRQPTFLLFLLIIFAKAEVKKCSNNGTLNEKGICTCPAEYIGQNCNISAVELKTTQIKIPITNNYTFAYFYPQQKVIYRFILTFCTSSPKQLDIILFAQQQQQNGNINLSPINQTQLLKFTITSNNQCKQIYSALLISADRKLNQEIPKIIFGIKSFTFDGNPQIITVKCQINSIFSISFLVVVVISFFVIAAFLMLGLMVLILRRKYLQRKQSHQKQQRKKQHVEKMMPIKKYQNLIQQTEQTQSQICSICLNQFKNQQNVRKTPCGHIYHYQCLDSWCNTHLNCPTCRKNFQYEEQELSNISTTFKNQNNHVRQAML